MAWTIYRWDDVGAPQLKSTDNALLTLLDAVLVGTGGVAYGTKPSAGWSGTNISSTVRAYTNAGTGKKIKVTHNAATQYAAVVGAESDIDAGPFFPTSAQLYGGVLWHISSTTDATYRPWIIAADNKRFYFWAGYNMTTAQALSDSTTFQFLHFAGDIASYKGGDGHCFALIGSVSTATTVNSMGAMQAAIGEAVTSGHYMCRSYTQTGGSIGFGKLADYQMSTVLTSGNATIPYPDPVSGGMLLSPIRLFEANTYGFRGILPGLWFVNHSLPGNNGDTFSGASVGQLAGKSFILLDANNSGSRARFALEISDTIGG